MLNYVWKTVYFEKPSPENTDETLRLAKERAESINVKNIVVASTTGATGVKASEIFGEGYNLVVVTHVTGFREPNVQELTPENRAILERRRVKIVTAAHSFGGIGRVVHKKFGSVQIDSVIAQVLRLFGQGMKVACVAADAGFIRTDEDAISIGGTSRGADTAILLRPSNTHAFFDIKVKEIICKPRL